MAPEYPIITAEKVESEVYRVINAILETEQSDITVAQAYLQIVFARCIGKLNLVEKSHVGSKDLIYQTVSYISANFKKKLSLEEMAKDLGVSKYVLSRLFSKIFHRNFNQYLNDARLNYACHRLENTSDSITNICLDSGFESQRTFNRVFKDCLLYTSYIVKMKMPTTSSDIDDLIIQASLWTVGWQFWIAGKAISATASYNQWTTFVFEIHVGVIQITSIHIHRVAPLFTLFIIVSFSAYFIQSNS